MLNALKAAGYITQDDLSARTTDRSSPQRAWIADSFAWLNGKATENMVANDDPHWLRNRFKQLFPGEIVLTRFEQWVADAELLPRRKRSPLAAMMLMAAVIGGGMALPEPKPKRKCLLKGCDVLTDHGGGYCCAEHHAEGERHTGRDQRPGDQDA